MVMEQQPARKPLLSQTYQARRAAAAAETRQAILQAAKEEFGTRGWAATTIRSIAARAGVSPKTIEWLFATKAALLEATLVSVSTGQVDTIDGLRHDLVERVEATRDMERAPDAATMLDLVVAAMSEANVRGGQLFCAVEAAVASDERLAEIWARLLESQRFAIRRWAEILLQKPGVRADLTLQEAEEILLLMCDWNVYRIFTTRRDMTPEQCEALMKRYYRRMLLA
jgi:AcrR family transcriptional regulator